MEKSLKLQLVNYLQEFVTEDRWQTINEVLSHRTRYLTVVLEDIYQPQNASAVLRSCDCFGIQDVHIIENRNEFNPNKEVTIGADQWISLHYYNKPDVNNTKRCYNQLQEQGYQIIATTPHKKDQTIDQVSIDEKTALVFGAELRGLSDYALEHADGYARIPMVGFSESFNISVGAALCLYDLTTRLRKSQKKWKLQDEEKLELQSQWLEKSIRAGTRLKAKFLKQQD
jgi:tRNA (guanosine-2'-O-)-methyltransferase